MTDWGGTIDALSEFVTNGNATLSTLSPRISFSSSSESRINFWPKYRRSPLL